MSSTVVLKNNVPRLLTITMASPNSPKDVVGGDFEQYKLMPAGEGTPVPAKALDCEVVQAWIKNGDVEIVDGQGVDNERDILFKEAESLGLKPRSNISVKSLKKLIAEHNGIDESSDPAQAITSEDQNDQMEQSQ